MRTDCRHLQKCILGFIMLMNNESLLLLLGLVLCLSTSAYATMGGSSLPDPYQTEWIVSSVDTLPLQERYDDFLTNPSTNPFDLNDPSVVTQEVEYDPETDTYIITERIGDDYFRMPTTMTFEEYLDFRAREQERDYFSELAGFKTGEGAEGRLDPIAKFDIENSLIDRLFGGTEVDIRPQGNIDLKFGLSYQNVENPALTERQRRQTFFDFDMNINMNVEGSIGEKLRLSTNYNTMATFDFDNQMKIDYNSDNFGEDDIIKKIEAGNVSLPLRSNLIQGAQSLFGLKTELQFGRLRVTAIASQQRSQRQEITVQGGSQFQEFEVRPDEYDENRHFFVSHYNRESFEGAMENLPQIRSLFRLQKVQVWVTNDRRETQNVRDIVAIADLGEPERRNMTNSSPAIQPPLAPKFRDITGQLALPDNNANPIDQLIRDNPRTRLVDRVVNILQSPPFNFQQARDFEKVTARQLAANEFTFHPELGFVSININVQPDQILGIAYQYTYKDTLYQVGQFADDVPQAGDSIQNQRVLFVKMLKSSTQRVDVPAWDLMMKNVYSIGAFQVTQKDFRLDILYEEPGGGAKRFLPDTEIAGKPLLNVFNLDNLNTQGDPQPDGVFDFVPDVTINTRNGRMMFPVLEPFGENLASQIPSPVDSARYVFQQLYDSTKTRAREFAYLNRFIIRGSYKSSVSSEIPLGAFNLPPGSVRVTAGGQLLEEGRDYEVDYNIGRVRILNDALLSSGVPVRVSFEDNSLFTFQNKTMLGLRTDFQVNRNLTLGSTYLHLFERPFTPKVNFGEDPINNKIYGFDLNYSTEVPWITRALDRLPMLQTKAPSNISFVAETAILRPGHSRAINENLGEDKGGVVYIDDFEGAINAIPLHTQPNIWVMSSVPHNDEFNNNPLFPESQEQNTILSGVNRALLNWYVIDEQVRGSSERNPYTMQINQREVFRNFSNPTGNFLLNISRTLDLSYYPDQRGSYNFEPPEGSAYSQGLNVDGTLRAPETRWGGIMRAIQTNDFQASNVEYIEFWMLSPFLDPDGTGGARPNPQDFEGDLYINLGNISEDILKDSRKFFENGLPMPDAENAEQQVVTTQWGRVPVVPQIVNAFDADPARREVQDVGLDGMNNEQEREFYAEYIQSLTDAGITGPLFDQAVADPSNDDYLYYNDPELEGETDILTRYIRYNHTEGNTPSASADERITTFGRTLPDSEDINNDLTLNETESYFQYRVPIEWDGGRGIDMRNEFVTDSVISEDGERVWYRYRIPLELPASNPNFTRVGGIQDFRSIRFIRVYMHGFKAPVTLRFARFDLVRNQWRRYILPDGPTSIGGPQEEGDVFFDVNDVNIEENSNRQPFSYILPPGIARERAIGVNLNALQNEQSLSLNVCNLGDGQERSIYKLTEFDMRVYEGLRMFMHGEMKPDDPNLKDGDLTVFIRIGSDFQRNYYEYEMPLVISDNEENLQYNDPAYQRVVWPEENEFQIDFEVLKELKILRNNSGTDLTALYPLEGSSDPNKPTARVRIKGNPNLGEIKGVMIGIRNPANDNLPHCAEVWVNELRLYGMDERGGMAALARLDVQLADLGNMSVAGNYSSIGYGALDQKVGERSREQVAELDLATSLELSRFLPENWGIRIPFYAQYSDVRRRPEFDPYDLDIELDRKIEEADPADRDSIRLLALDLTRIRSFAFTNVRKEAGGGGRGGAGGAPKLWSISNFGLTYAQSVTEHSDPIIELDKIRSYRGILDYAYSRNVTYIEPIKKIFGDSKYLKLFTDFNFNPLPNSIGFSTQMERLISETTYRFSSPEFSTFYNKRWTWDRTYDVSWDITRSLRLNFNALNLSVIDEPDGLINNETKRTEVLDNIYDFGRNKEYGHNLAVTYNVPLKLIPLLDFATVRATYTASYNWSAAALNTLELGNVIQNTQTRNVNAELDFEKLYNKSKYLKKINTPARPTPAGRGRTGRDTGPTRGGTPDGDDKDKEKKDPNPGKLERGLIRPLLVLRRARLTYSENFGTVIPGFMPDTEYLGTSNNFSAPGLGFVAGWQPNLRPQDYYTADDWLYNNYEWISKDQFLNQQIMQNYTQDIDARVTLEPIRDFRVEVSAVRSFSQFHSEDFRRDTVFSDPNIAFQEEYRHLNGRDMGSFTMSYFAMNTLFNNDIASLFNQFEENRVVAANRLADRSIVGGHPEEFQDSLGYPFAFGRTQQSVLLPSFIAAYSGQDINEIPLEVDYTEVLFKKIPLPNWRLTYNGLAKVKPLDKIFTNISITHGYQSTMTINSFETELLFTESDPDRLNPETGDFYSRFEVPSIVISEQLAPLIGIDVRTKNDVSLRVDFKKSRNLQMSFLDNGLNETKTSEYDIGFGYRLRNFELPFGNKKKKPARERSLLPDTGQRGGGGGGAGGRNAGDLDISFDFRLRDDVTIRHLLDQPVQEPTRGTRSLSILPAVEYQLNQQLSLRFFFDYRKTIPKVSTSFPITNASGGVMVRFTLN